MKKYQGLLNKINILADEIKRPINIMEVCGTHTQAISQNGLRQLMPANINLITGPGCPVCVTAQFDIDNIIAICQNGIPVATYGDMIRVPGHSGSLEEAGANGGKVFPVYSIEEALKLKDEYPELVFFGLGFETTTPMTAYAIKKGLTVYSTHKLFFPAMQALLKNNRSLDGFINPGHVSVIIGTEKYKSIKAPQVITGFEAEDILISIYLLLKQIKNKEKKVENEYTRAVTKNGNKKAYNLIFEVFKVGTGNWRGLGSIPGSGLDIKNKYSKLDAKIIYLDLLSKIKHPKNFNPQCKCGDIIQGLIKPQDCPMFNISCNPDRPHGPCMVSSEGACHIEYEYK